MRTTWFQKGEKQVHQLQLQGINLVMQRQLITKTSSVLEEDERQLV